MGGRVLLQRVAQRQDRGLLRQGIWSTATTSREAQHGQQYEHKHQHVQPNGRRLEAVRQREAREGRPRPVRVAEVPVVPARRGVARERRVRVLDLAEGLSVAPFVRMCCSGEAAVGLLDDGRVGGGRDLEDVVGVEDGRRVRPRDRCGVDPLERYERAGAGDS